MQKSTVRQASHLPFAIFRFAICDCSGEFTIFRFTISDCIWPFGDLVICVSSPYTAREGRAPARPKSCVATAPSPSCGTREGRAPARPRSCVATSPSPSCETREGRAPARPKPCRGDDALVVVAVESDGCPSARLPGPQSLVQPRRPRSANIVQRSSFRAATQATGSTRKGWIAQISAAKTMSKRNFRFAIFRFAICDCIWPFGD